jgi:hypothetical protein
MRYLVAGVRGVLGAVGGAVFCGAATYWYFGGSKVELRLLAVLVFAACVGILAGGLVGASSGRLLGAFLLGASVGAVLAPATVFGLLALPMPGTEAGGLLLAIALLISSPVDALFGGLLSVAMACVGSRRAGALLLGAFIGAVLPPANTLAMNLPVTGAQPGWWQFVMSPLLIGSPIHALIVDLFAVYVLRARLRPLGAFLRGGIIGAFVTPANTLAVNFLLDYLVTGRITGWGPELPALRMLLISSSVSAWIVGGFGAWIAWYLRRDNG